MQIPNLEAFNEVPFLFWAKDKSGTYRWGNQAINLLAGENVVGMTDRELVWCDDAEALQAADRKVFETGEPAYIRERINQSSRGEATLNVCKWLGEIDGKKHCFGISFTIEP